MNAIQTFVLYALAAGFIAGYAAKGIEARGECNEQVVAFIEAMRDAGEAVCADDTSCSRLCEAEGRETDCWADLDPTGEEGR